jgi:hypothetical protein
LELYFYDDDPNLEHRFRHSPNLDRDVIQRVVDILKRNPYSQTFRNLHGVDDLEEHRIELNTHMRLDQQRYNLPISSEVAAVWVESNDLCKHFERSIILFGKDNTRHRIHPLSYPLFFPRGEMGWHPEIPKVGVSMDEVLRSCGIHRQSQGYSSKLVENVFITFFISQFTSPNKVLLPTIFRPIYEYSIVSQLESTIATSSKCVVVYLTPCYMANAYSNNMWLTCTSKLKALGWTISEITKKIRADMYQGLVDCLLSGEHRGNAVGR